MSRGVKRRTKQQIDHQTAYERNVAAQVEGPSKKKWTKHDIRAVKPLTDNQSTMFRAYYEGAHVCAYGSAGTGKTFQSCFLGISDVIDPLKPQNQLIIVRSAVQGRDVGFMPGTLEEKNAYYEAPYVDIMTELFYRTSAYADMKAAGIVKFLTTSFIRGVTWDDAVIVIDEAQNMTWEELNTVMTRVGKNSRVIICGDVRQNDLIKKASDVSGMGRLLRTIDRMDEFIGVEFTHDDIVRSRFVKSWIIASEQTS